jgi:hypothetical protein
MNEETMAHWGLLPEIIIKIIIQVLVPRDREFVK